MLKPLLMGGRQNVEPNGGMMCVFGVVSHPTCGIPW